MQHAHVYRLVGCLLMTASLAAGSPAWGQDTVRFATFNTNLSQSSDGGMLNTLSAPGNSRANIIAEIIQRTNPDVILLNEFDFEPNLAAVNAFQTNYLGVAQDNTNSGAFTTPVNYSHVFIAPSNTGVPSGFDLDNDGNVGGAVGSQNYADDSFGFGRHEGEFGMVLLSKFPILGNDSRTFQNFLWKDMPGALLPEDPNNQEPTTGTESWYSAAELDVVRLSSKSHWDVAVDVNGQTVHALAAHPTPPVFDGAEDRNGRRNHDEIRFWADYVTPGAGNYITDDDGGAGGLAPGESFVILGDYNADPFDGDSTNNAALQLINNPNIQASATDTAITPDSAGGTDATNRSGGFNLTHLGDPAFDTGDFFDGASPGNIRVDYVLPSNDLGYLADGVFWPTDQDPLFGLVGDFPFPASDHRLVFVDLLVPEPATALVLLSLVGAGALARPRRRGRL